MPDLIMKLADAFASAAVEPAGWMPALKDLAEATGSARGQLIGIGGTSTVPFNWVNDFPESAFDEFLTIDGGNALVNTRIAVSIDAPVLAVRSEVDYRAAQPHLATDIYADFCRAHDLPHGCQTKLLEGQEGMIGLAVLRTAQEGPTTHAQRKIFAAAAPHVRSAVRMQIALERDGAHLLAGALEDASGAVFICNGDGRLRASTPAADLLLERGHLRVLDRRLAAFGRKDNVLLSQTLARHGGAYKLPLETLAIGGRPDELPLILDIVSAPRRPWSLGFLPEVLVIARGGSQWHASAERLLRLLYGLSAAEADVALRLASGQSRAEIADRRQSQISTVRSQIKTIFIKLGVAREIDLVVMFMKTFGTRT